MSEPIPKYNLCGRVLNYEKDLDSSQPIEWMKFDPFADLARKPTGWRHTMNRMDVCLWDEMPLDPDD
ncbi:MAG: hypothetical protein WBW55_08890 [Desulfobaccales bacterium]